MRRDVELDMILGKLGGVKYHHGVAASRVCISVLLYNSICVGLYSRPDPYGDL